MSRRRLKGTARVVAHVEEDPSRGQVFWFLFREHDAIMDRIQGKRMSWITLLADIKAMALKNADGRPLDNLETLKSTFKRVRAFKRKLDQAKQQRAAERRRPTNDPPPMVWSPGAYQAPMQVPGDRSVNRPTEPIDPIERLRLKTLRMSGKRV